MHEKKRRGKELAYSPISLESTECACMYCKNVRLHNDSSSFPRSSLFPPFSPQTICMRVCSSLCIYNNNNLDPLLSPLRVGVGGWGLHLPPCLRVSQFNVPVAVAHDRGDGGVGTLRCGGSLFFLPRSLPPARDCPCSMELQGGKVTTERRMGEGGIGHGGDKKKKEEEGGGFGDMAEKWKMLPSPSSFLSLRTRLP